MVENRGGCSLGVFKLKFALENSRTSSQVNIASVRVGAERELGERIAGVLDGGDFCLVPIDRVDGHDLLGPFDACVEEGFLAARRVDQDAQVEQERAGWKMGKFVKQKTS